MDNEQNMYDVIRQLTDSVNEPSSTEPIEVSEDIKNTESVDELQEMLKDYYGVKSDKKKKVEASPYDIDASLLEEFLSDETADEGETANIEINDVSDDNQEDDQLDTLITEFEQDDSVDVAEYESESPRASAPVAVMENSEIADSEFEDSEIEEYMQQIYEDAEHEKQVDDLPDVIEDTVIEVEQDDALEADEDDLFDIGADDLTDEIDGELVEEITDEVADETDEIDDIIEDIAAERPEEDIHESTAQTDLYSDAPKYKPISFKALMMDYGHPDPSPEPEQAAKAIKEEISDDETDTPDIGDILSDFCDDRPTKQESVNDSMRTLMSSLGCEDELDSISPEALDAAFGEFNGSYEEYDEKKSAERKNARRDEYKKRITLSAIKLTACVLAVIAIFLYDTLPMFDVDFLFLADYVSYPGAYVMIGTQLLLICALCLWRPMIDGIKRLATPHPNIYSMVAVMVIANILYDIVYLINSSYEPMETPMFHFMSGMVILSVSVMELLEDIREAKAFDLYSSDVAKFTLSYEIGDHSIAGKMYAGGFSKERAIYKATPVSRPKGFTKAFHDGREFDSSFMSVMIHGAAIVYIVAAIAFMLLGRDPDIAVISAMTVLYMLLPIGFIVSTMIPLALSTVHLAKRGIALTGRKTVKKYSEATVLVFNDLHLFSKCSPKDVGFVCYEKLQMNGVIAALDILYSRIGGPMTDVFANIPEQNKAKRIRVRRITRNGVEAVVDKSHTLIVGDREFMRRYGIEFPTKDGMGKYSSNAVLYVSYDGRATAKLSAVYKIDPAFDMLIERLSAENGHCVIETYDPMINTAFVAALRKKGRSPISVVHKNASDINRAAGARQVKNTDNGILAVSSRLKLVEAVVWCSRIRKIEKASNIITYISMGLGAVLTIAAAVLGFTTCAFQYLLLGYLALFAVLVFALTIAFLPGKSYFSLSAFEAEDIEEGQTKKT